MSQVSCKTWVAWAPNHWETHLKAIRKLFVIILARAVPAEVFHFNMCWTKNHVTWASVTWAYAGFGDGKWTKKISTVGTLRSQHSPLLVEEQLISEHWEQPLIRASRARNVDSAERRHGQHEPRHVQKSSAGGRVATVGVYFFWVKRGRFPIQGETISSLSLLCVLPKARITHTQSSCFLEGWRGPHSRL